MFHLKLKALFQIVILITSLFIVTFLNTSPVTARQDACCEKTKEGEYCQYTAQRNCDTAFNVAQTTCDQTSFCQPVCCIDTQNGQCFKNVAAAQCYNQGGTTDAQNPNCDINQCKAGCCSLGNEHFLSTKTACLNAASKYPHLNKDQVFDPSTQTEIQCINKGRQQDEGCCVNNDACSYTSRGKCTGTFHQGRYCSDTVLTCGCTSKHEKRCVEGEEDVYWFDSCGNKEGLVENCDFTKGTSCQRKNGDVACHTIHCTETAALPNNPHDPRIEVGGPRKHGESWCTYESGVGDFLDRPGSIHYRHICFNGQELIETGRDFREQVCVQTETPEGLSTGNFVLNEIYDSEVTTNVSTVPRGQKFWDGSNADICQSHTTSCTVIWAKKSRVDDWDCSTNCHCESPEYIKNMTRYCKQAGDCGADVNILGHKTTDGVQIEWLGTDRGARPNTVPEFYWNYTNVFGVYGGLLGLRQIFEDIAGSPPDVPGMLETTTLGITVGLVIVATILTYAIPAFNTALFALGSVISASVPVIGVIVVALLVLVSFILGGGSTATKTVTINCLPWQPPATAEYCEQCTEDKRYNASSYINPTLCSEYRCKSLGAACKLVNHGTKDQACVGQNPNDVNAPIITPWREALNSGLQLSETPDGYYIQPEIPAFRPVTFGIRTDEPAQCKLATKHTDSYEKMSSFFGGNLYTTEKNITLNLPGGKDYTYYVRCQDHQGSSNVKEYFIQFSTDKEPDKTPPIIESTSIANNAYVSADTNATAVTHYLNEPSNCQWSLEDQSMENMPQENIFICDTTVNQEPKFYNLYACRGAFAGIQPNAATTFYTRCKDLAGNEQQQSHLLTLKGTTKLSILSAGPTGDIETRSPMITVVTGDGAEQGKAICHYKQNNFRSIRFINTDATTHTQPLKDLGLGQYTYSITCADVASNTAKTDISFKVTVDDKPPRVTNIYSDKTTLYLSTDEPSSCAYSTTKKQFTKDEGTPFEGILTEKHSTSLTATKYYVICWDERENTMQPITIHV